MRRCLPQLIFALLALGMLLLREAQYPPLAGLEQTFVNWLAANASAEHSRAPVTLVEINDNCLSDYPWPWSPLDYALFLNGTLQFKARVAAIEPVLAWDEKTLSPAQVLQQPQFEKYLQDCVLRTPKLVLGAHLGYPDDPDALPSLQPMPVLRNVNGPTAGVPDFTAIEAEPGENLRLAAPLGFSNAPTSESVAMHAPLVFRYRGQMVPSFVLESLILWYGLTPDDVTVRLGASVRLGDKLTIPIDAAGGMPVDWSQPYDRIGFDDLLLAVDQLQRGHVSITDPAKLNDRLLVLARTDSQARTLALPTGRMGSPGELFAAALATAETSAFARPAGWPGGAAVLLAGVAMGWTLAGRRKAWVALVTVGYVAGYLLLALVIFEAAHVALPLTPMLGLAVFVAGYRLLAPDGRV